MATKMSRTHFQFIADILKDTGAPKGVVTGFGQGLKRTNPNFDLNRFLNAVFGKKK